MRMGWELHGNRQKTKKNPFLPVPLPTPPKKLKGKY
jgi:hypothetical protein